LLNLILLLQESIKFHCPITDVITTGSKKFGYEIISLKLTLIMLYIYLHTLFKPVNLTQLEQPNYDTQTQYT